MIPLGNLFQRSLALLATAFLLTSCGGGTPTSADGAKPVLLASVVSTPSTKDYYTVVQQIYVSYFGRPADPAGQEFWAQQLLNAGAPNTLKALKDAYYTNASVKAIVDFFGTSQESKELYPGDNNAFLEAIYQNLFSRSADAAGKAFWADLIDRGLLTRSAAALTLMADSAGSDITIINNKINVAAQFSSALDSAAKLRGYDGSAANQIVRVLLGTVVASSNTAAYQAIISATIGSLVSQVKVEGLFTGPLGSPSASSYFQMLTLDDGEYWMMYGAKNNGVFTVANFMQGHITSINGTLISTDLRDFGNTPVVTANMNGSFVPVTSISASVTLPFGAINVNGTYDTSSGYDYSTAANLADVVGNWTLQDTRKGVNAVTIKADGSFSGGSDGCNFTGTIKPRTGGKNVFSVTAAFANTGCGTTNLSISGVALSYPIKGTALRQLIIAGVNAERSFNGALFGTR